MSGGLGGLPGGGPLVCAYAQGDTMTGKEWTWTKGVMSRPPVEATRPAQAV